MEESSESVMKREGVVVLIVGFVDFEVLIVVIEFVVIVVVNLLVVVGSWFVFEIGWVILFWCCIS